MPAFRLMAAAALAATLAMPLAAPKPARAADVPFKVALIVGPTGSGTASNRAEADAIAQQAIALGATVSKAYSPNATYAKVRAAVAGANIIVYMGHGNGFPNPYNTKLYPDRNNGWGLNTTTTHGDADSWSNGTMVYCGEKALMGQLTASDGAAQRQYCGGGAIAPAPGFVMVYVGACYTGGGNENGAPAATNSDARAHVAYYSRPILTGLGGSAYFAGHAGSVVADLLANPDSSYGDIYWDNLPYDVTGAYDLQHQLVSAAREWLSRRSYDPYWYYAFAGDPARTFAGGTSTFTAPTGTADFEAPRFVSRSPKSGATGVSRSTRVVVKFSEPVTYVLKNVTLWRGTNKVSATVTYDPATLTATLTPASRLAGGVTYKVKISTSVRDAAGNRFTLTTWKFKTAY